MGMLAKRARVNKKYQCVFGNEIFRSIFKTIGHFQYNVRGERENIEFLGVENENFL